MIKKTIFKRIFFSTVILFIALILYSLNFCQKDEIKIYGYDNYKTNYIESIYTLNEDDYISKTSIYVDYELTTLEKVKQVIETLIENNNKNALLPSYFKPILPQNTKILGVHLENKIIKINFSKELLNINEEQSEHMIEAIVYTLTDIEDINGVEIYVENSLLKYIPHTNKELSAILTKDFGINKNYSITNNSDVSKVILYFLGSDNNYIPITKYVNDSREKVEIVIEALTDDYIYLRNLVSKINSKVELISYNFYDNTLDLVFNNYIFDMEENISDETINLITYAMFENYDLDVINIFVDNKENLIKSVKNIE